MDNLRNYLNKEIEAREWTVTELARRAELSWATVGDVLNGKAKPGLRFYIGMSRALKVSVDYMLRLAGELPASIGTVDDLDGEESQLIEIWRALPPGPPRDTLLKLARGWVDQIKKDQGEE